uniref:Uncharacterized protein n=1 Tax=Aegilops tauschii subsp. strangulata TaxID=200361 RepID=A0A453P878_AEGTS
QASLGSTRRGSNGRGRSEETKPRFPYQRLAAHQVWWMEVAGVQSRRLENVTSTDFQGPTAWIRLDWVDFQKRITSPALTSQC